MEQSSRARNSLLETVYYGYYGGVGFEILPLRANQIVRIATCTGGYGAEGGTVYGSCLENMKLGVGFKFFSYRVFGGVRRGYETGCGLP